MKIIKRIVITLVVLAGIISIAGFLSPAHVHVERSLTVNAPAEIIHAQINTLKNWETWSPWHKIDTAMKVEYFGGESGAGAGYKWSSDHSDVGNGEMTITASSPDSISTAMNFMENGVATGKFAFAKSDSGTKITWSMENDMGMNPIGRIFGLFMDKMVGPDFEKGLASIKEVAESVPAGPKKYRGFEVMEMDSPELVYVGKKDSLGWDKITEFYTKNLHSIFEAVEKQKLECAASPSGLFFKWDETNKSCIMAASVAVKGDANTKVKGFETFVVTSGKMLHIAYYGGYHGTGEAHYAMDDYMKEKGMTQLTPVAEEYVTDPGKEPDSTKWLTNIYYHVQ